MLMLIANQDEVTSISNKHFNTSHVNVNQVKVLHHQQKNIYFNTSHVNVNHTHKGEPYHGYIISIHLMLMLI